MGLINVEDRSGILTLDKGKSMSFVRRHHYYCIITAPFVCAFVNLKLQICSSRSLLVLIKHSAGLANEAVQRRLNLHSVRIVAVLTQAAEKISFRKMLKPGLGPRHCSFPPVPKLLILQPKLSFTNV